MCDICGNSRINEIEIQLDGRPVKICDSCISNSILINSMFGIRASGETNSCQPETEYDSFGAVTMTPREIMNELNKRVI